MLYMEYILRDKKSLKLQRNQYLFSLFNLSGKMFLTGVNLINQNEFTTDLDRERYVTMSEGDLVSLH